MSTSRPADSTDRLAILLTLARLLERLERSAVSVTADQYRTVVLRLSEALQEATPDASLKALLDAYPATAELYENLNYAHAGLCRASLERSLATETAARQVIARASARRSDRQS